MRFTKNKTGAFVFNEELGRSTNEHGGLQLSLFVIRTAHHLDLLPLSSLYGPRRHAPAVQIPNSVFALLPRAMAGRRHGERQPSPWPMPEDEDSGAFPSAILLFALVGAAGTTAAVRLLLSLPLLSLRSPYQWISNQSQSDPGVQFLGRAAPLLLCLR
jgi:hypothetical protein